VKESVVPMPGPISGSDFLEGRSTH
jgi:hypothetical protein